MNETAILTAPETAIATAPHAADETAAAPLLFTDAAARKVGELIAGEGNPKLMLRVYVQGGGLLGPAVRVRVR